MLDQSADGRIVTSSDVFNVIEMDMASTASSMTLTAPEECTYSLGARALTVAEAREIVLSRTAPDQRPAVPA